ncbi:hypothetical protein Tco_0621801 [Tanacetum coccineum]
MDQDSAHMVAASKVPMLKPGEYEIWRMRIEQYIQMIDYALWEVIENAMTQTLMWTCTFYDDEDNGDHVVVPQTPNEEMRTRIYNTGIPPSLVRGIEEDKIWDRIRNLLSPNHTERGYSICCKNTINMINSIKDLREENRDIF